MDLCEEHAVAIENSVFSRNLTFRRSILDYYEFKSRYIICTANRKTMGDFFGYIQSVADLNNFDYLEIIVH